MTLYAELAATATELLAEFGQQITRRAATAGAYDPAQGSASTTTSESLRRGALFDFDAGQTLVRGTAIQRRDKQLLLDATGPVAATDIFVINGGEYSVVSIGELNPAGTPVMYDLHVRL